MSDKETITAGNLREKTLNGFKWTFLDNVGRLGGQFVIGIVLARILTPEDFGLIGMLTIFIVIGRSLTNSGFGQALIQKKDANRIDFSTVFYFNIFTSIIIYLIIFVGSPLIAKFYREPQLVLLTKVLCLEFILNALSLIHITDLQKNLKFKAPSLIGIISVAISGATSIVLALKGFGVWALVTNTILQSLITTLLLWKVSKWRPLLIFSVNSLKSLFAYGSKILLAGILNSVFKNIYFLVIGRYFQAESLGYYTRANQFTYLPLNTITLVITKVTYPVFSSIQDDIPKLKIGYTKSIRMLSALALPLMGIMYIIARPIIIIVLGDKWLPVVLSTLLTTL
jgi:O-antigen/teichoic acid export membrane protein